MQWQQPQFVVPQQEKYLSISDVFLLCEKPHFDACGRICGCVTCCFSGFGLFFCPCYGMEKPDCCNVAVSGLLMECTAPCIWGWVAACCVGWKMIC